MGNQQNMTNVVQCEDHADLFFDVKEIVHSKFVPSVQTINQQFLLPSFDAVVQFCATKTS